MQTFLFRALGMLCDLTNGLILRLSSMVALFDFYSNKRPKTRTNNLASKGTRNENRSAVCFKADGERTSIKRHY